MREFVGFKRTAVVIVPDEPTFTERRRLREEKDGKDVPDCAVWEMKGILHFKFTYIIVNYYKLYHSLYLCSFYLFHRLLIHLILKYHETRQLSDTC